MVLLVFAMRPEAVLRSEVKSTKNISHAKKVCYMSQVLRFNNVFLRPIFGFHRASNGPSYSFDAPCKALTKCERLNQQSLVKFVFSKNETNFDKIFTDDLTLTPYCQIDGEDFIKFCGLLRKHELY